jgi:hypothetical protein
MDSNCNSIVDAGTLLDWEIQTGDEDPEWDAWQGPVQD